MRWWLWQNLKILPFLSHNSLDHFDLHRWHPRAGESNVNSQVVVNLTASHLRVRRTEDLPSAQFALPTARHRANSTPERDDHTRQFFIVIKMVRSRDVTVNALSNSHSRPTNFATSKSSNASRRNTWAPATQTRLAGSGGRTSSATHSLPSSDTGLCYPTSRWQRMSLRPRFGRR